MNGESSFTKNNALKVKWLKRVGGVGAGILGGLAFLFWKYEYQQKVFAKSRWWKRRHREDSTCLGAVERSRTLVADFKAENGCPGLSIAVAVNGNTVWSEALGFADLENQVPFDTGTVVKIGSISKPLTTTAALKLFDMGALDLDEDIRKYTNDWPQKTWKGKSVIITVRNLLSHLGGVRDYERKLHNMSMHSSDSDQEFCFEEYFNTERFTSTKESLKLFKEDPLICQPGNQFHYTTHGFTLLSVVMEGAIGQTFDVIIKGLFSDLGLERTFLDENDTLLYNRARHYVRNPSGNIVNAPFVDSSCKWAGAGMLSTVEDLVRFGNILLYSYQCCDKDESEQNSSLATQSTRAETNYFPGYLKPDTVAMMWTPVLSTKVSWNGEGAYGMGCQILPFPGKPTDRGAKDRKRFAVAHTGGTVGASGVWLVVPSQPGKIMKPGDEELGCPQGTVVAILVNLQTTGIGQLAMQVAENFDRVSTQFK